MKNSILMRNVLLLACLLGSSHAFADPVQFDTDSAHVIVIRPIDLWSGSERSNDFIIDSYKNKQVRYSFFDDDGKQFLGESSLFHPMEKDGVAQDVALALKPLGFVNGGMRGSIFTVRKASTITAAEMAALNQRQDTLYTQIVIRNGNPSLIAGKIRKGEWKSIAISLAVAGVGVNKLGTSFGANGITSGIAQQTYQLSMEAQQSLIPVPAVAFDYSQYKTVDIRKVEQGPDRTGEIIIAYKGDRTPETEREALAKAIVTASGADTTLDAIQAAQAKDLATRQAVWDECVSSGQCKND